LPVPGFTTYKDLKVLLYQQQVGHKILTLQIVKKNILFYGKSYYMWIFHFKSQTQMI